MTLSENQVRHFYAVKAIGTVDKNAAIGTLQKVVTPEGDLYFKYMSPGGIIRTDLIPACNFLYANLTDSSALKKGLKKVTVKLVQDIDLDGENDTAVPMGTYVIRIAIKNYIGMSDEDHYFKYGQVYSNGKMTAAKFYEAMAKSLNANLAKEAAPLFEITAGADKVEIKEVEQPWVLGTKARTNVDFEVQLVSNGMDFVPETDTDGTVIYEWGTVKSEMEYTLPNSKDIADMEYFLMGERGDIYRGKGWPNVIPTQYVIDPTDATGYAVLDIHYAFVGSNEAVQKSEKTMTFASQTASLDTLASGIASDLGVKITHVSGNPGATTVSTIGGE